MRDGSQTREKIDRTAMRLFVEKGIAETTVRDIAAAAGIAEGTLYRHYPSKEELAWQLFVVNFTAIGATLNELQRAEKTIHAKLDAIIRHFCSVFERDAVTFNYLFLARHRHMLRLTPRQPNPYLVFRSVVREGMAHGEIPKQDLDVATSMVMGLILQVIDARILGRRIPQDVETLADTLIQASYRVLNI
ncbi:MAG: TetR/AcrR family transcriptional regulator [Alphaproteobacteria bacterium]|nr:TetR/AcrR family transcriptional regulator [Alphaproteobacteria bacterium]